MEHRAIHGNMFGDNTRIHLGDVIYRTCHQHSFPHFSHCRPTDALTEHAHDTFPERSLERLDSLPEASFDAANKQHVATCLPNTRRDILAQIRKWADGDGGQRIYWLNREATAPILEPTAI